MTKPLLLALLLSVSCTLSAQNIRNRYVQRVQEDGTIYHTFPCTLFENADAGDLTFDITYKAQQDGMATLNFTCTLDDSPKADSVVFDAGHTQLRGAVERIYIEPERRLWKHRYLLRVPVESFRTFFDDEALPQVTLHVGERRVVYRAKRSAWHSYAPVGYKIFETIRVNEAL